MTMRTKLALPLPLALIVMGATLILSPAQAQTSYRNHGAEICRAINQNQRTTLPVPLSWQQTEPTIVVSRTIVSSKL